MSTLGYILLFTLIGSAASLIGGIFLLLKEKFAIKISHFLSAFAAGALLGTAFFDLLPEAFEESKHYGGEINIFLWTLGGFLVFFLLERGIHWSHHHMVSDKYGSRTGPKSVVPLIIIGDSVHNFIDGIIIASTFLVNIPLGIITSFAVAAHEIPQEIGDFGILLSRGLKRSKILWLNILSALTAIVGALLAYYLGAVVEGLIPIFLSVAAGFFLYIAASDLIPEIHSEEKRTIALIETLMLLLGVVVIWFAVILLEGVAH
jgi:zinc and cadmium transporter